MPKENTMTDEVSALMTQLQETSAAVKRLERSELNMKAEIAENKRLIRSMQSHLRKASEA